MIDAFDRPKDTAKEELYRKKAEKKEFSKWQKQFIEAIEGKWFEFEHPKLGVKVKGKCVHSMYSGMTKINNIPGFEFIPDFSIHFFSKKGNEVIASLVESRAQLCQDS